MANFTIDVGSSLDSTTNRDLYIPTKIAQGGVLSDTAEAYVCFTEQQFSNKLQAYLVNYVLSVSSYYNVFL